MAINSTTLLSTTPEVAQVGSLPSDIVKSLGEWLETVYKKDEAYSSVFDFMTNAEINSTVLRTLSSDCTDSIRNALASGRSITFPRGDYLVTGELEITTAGQVVNFEGTGGYGYGEDIGRDWQPNTRLVVKDDNFTRRVRTRRKYRGSSSDPDDSPLSVVLNIQAEGVVLNNVCVWLNCDYSDPSPTNLGDDVDVAIFTGTRVGTQFHNPTVVGYFRKAGIYIDVSGHSELPRFNDLQGNPYPEGTVKNGSDGTHLWNPYIRGPRQGLAVLGASPKAGESDYTTDYYDGLSDATITDRRGSFGCSDFEVFGGRIYGPDHHSDRRLKDPETTGGVLDEASSLSEPEDAPAAIHIDGLAGNSSTNLWGMRFFGTRIATFEAFRVRLGKVSRVFFYSCHIEGRNGGRENTSGVEINTNDYTSNSYGDIYCGPDSDRVSVIGTARDTINGGIAPHNYGEPLDVQTDTGAHFTADYIAQSSGELDLRGSDGEGIRFRSGNTTIGRIDSAGIYSTTTASAANVVVSSSNILQRSTSALKYKDVQGGITEDQKQNFLKLDGINYKSKCEGDNPDVEHVGVIADQAHGLGLHDLVTYSESGEVEGFSYERATVYLLEIVKDLQSKLNNN